MIITDFIVLSVFISYIILSIDFFRNIVIVYILRYIDFFYH